VRALLIVNPWATATTAGRRQVIARALASELDLEVVQTRYRGHARHVAEAAAEAGHRLVLTLGGDGTANEAVNGLLRAGGARGDGPAAGGHPRPALAPLPGGNANVFTRSLGLPTDPVDATGRILTALGSGQSRTIGIGLAGGRYFCFNAGLGIDAEVVRMVEGLRASGKTATGALYVRSAIRQFYTVTDRREPALTLLREGHPAVEGLFCAFVSNTTPWTYLGRRPVSTSPAAGFGTGLDLFGLRSLRSATALRALRGMLRDDGRPPGGRHMVSVHDESAFTLAGSRPVAFQVDGEYVGERDHITFRAVPDALRVIVPDSPGLA
jgi:diacylglycerol kinase family enzyme